MYDRMKRVHSDMTNANGFSDSQESALLDKDAYDELEREIGIDNFPLLAEEVTEVMPEEKYDINHFQGKKLKDEKMYLPELDAPLSLHEDFPGDLNFHYLLNNQCNSKHWVYSSQLQKVFINMEQTLPLHFKWDPPLDGLYLRTSMVFSLDQYRNDPVQRCHNHMALSNHNNQDIDPMKLRHVVHCLNPCSIYEEQGGHLCIITPLRTPQVGSQYVPMYFQFLCKNSCTSGMNRRPTELIFTLEDEDKRILGRRSLGVRVCSCPKRDKEKEEVEKRDNQLGIKKRKLSNGSSSLTMMPSCDTHVFSLQVDIVGKENYLSVLKYAYDVMAGQAARTGQYDFFKPYMDNILRKAP